jgi:glucose-6-phosphate 1-dehydrogenase
MGKSENQILIIFGASGNLTMRKIMPSLRNLAMQNLLPERFAVIGVGRMVMSDQDFRNKMSAALKTSRMQSNTTFDETNFINSLYYQSIDTFVVSDYSKLKLKISKILSTLAIPENII